MTSAVAPASRGMIMRERWGIALLLVVVSIVVHAVASWRFAREIEPFAATPADRQVIVLTVPEPDPYPELDVEPEQPLEFEAELDFVPPEILVAPRAAVPPPPDVTTALRAQAAGFAGLDLDIGPSSMPVSGPTGLGGFKAGIGNGLGDGSARFAAYVEQLREVGLDVVFVIDSTGSMGWVLDEVKERIADIAHFVRTLVPVARFGFVAYRDRNDPDFVTRVQPLTYSTSKLLRYLATLEAAGGGDWFEEIDAGIRDAIGEAGWRPGAHKQIIVIGDAPMRPRQLPEVLRLVSGFRGVGGVVSTLDVSEQANPHLVEAKRGKKVKMSLYRNRPMEDFREIGRAGAGDAATLDGDAILTRRLVELIMGDEFAVELQGLMDML